MSRDTKRSSHLQDAARRQIEQFRVTELQSFLTSCGLPKGGRKEELRQRCLLYVNNTIQTGKYQQVLNKLDDFNRKRHPKMAPTRPTASASSMPLAGPLSCHVSVDVQMKALPYHPIITVLSKPRLLPTYGRAKHSPEIQSIDLNFNLTPKQADQIRDGKLVMPQSSYSAVQGTTCKFKTEVLLRFGACELSCAQDDQYPVKCSVDVFVNHQRVQLPGYQPQKTPTDKSRYGQPVEITQCLDLRGASNNVHIRCGQAQDATRKYVASIELCTKQSAAELLQVVGGRIRSAEISRAFIKQKLSGGDSDMEIATTSLRVSLICPIGKTRMVYPGRSNRCSHVQCFDMANYLQMNECRARWICPVCDCPAEFDTLTIDGLTNEVLEKCPSSVSQVEYLHDGTWTPYPKPGHTKTCKPSSSSAVSSMTVSSATAIEDDEVPLVCDLSASNHSLDVLSDMPEVESDPDPEPASNAGHVVIDLTLDDSDDDDESANATAAAVAPAPSHVHIPMQSAISSLPVSSGGAAVGLSSAAAPTVAFSTAATSATAAAASIVANRPAIAGRRDTADSRASRCSANTTAASLDLSLPDAAHDMPALSTSLEPAMSDLARDITQTAGSSDLDLGYYNVDMDLSSGWPHTHQLDSGGAAAAAGSSTSDSLLLWPYESIPGLGGGDGGTGSTLSSYAAAAEYAANLDMMPTPSQPYGYAASSHGQVRPSPPLHRAAAVAGNTNTMPPAMSSYRSHSHTASGGYAMSSASAHGSRMSSLGAGSSSPPPSSMSYPAMFSATQQHASHHNMPPMLNYHSQNYPVPPSEHSSRTF